jgi:subtilisin family serine protease
MSPRHRGWKTWLSLLLAMAGLGTGRSALADTLSGGDRQILVMLRQPPQHFRPDADYGGGYGDMLARSARERISRRIARAHRLAIDGDWPMPLLGVDCFIMTVSDGRTPEEAAAEVSRDPGVEWSQPMHVYRTKGVPAAYNDPLYPAEPAARLWHLADLHRIATGRGVTVAVVDTRVDEHHPDLAGQVAVNEDFVAGRPSPAESHGTGVAGIIAAKGGNDAGIVGIAPNARIMALRACWQLPGAEGSVCDSISLAKALHFAIEHRAQVINLSLGGPPDILLSKLIDIGIERGETFVAAYDPALSDGGFPASHGGVIAVADAAMAMPSRGVYTAPGRDIPTTEPGGRWYLVDGSSYAAAHVSGLIALLRERRLPADGAISLVSARAGGGAVDALASLQRVSRACDGSDCGRQLAANTHP